jgi:hypothetical protein
VLSGQTIDRGQRTTVLVGDRTVAELRSLAEEQRCDRVSS